MFAADETSEPEWTAATTILCFVKGHLTFRYKTAAGRNRTLDPEFQYPVGIGRAQVRTLVMAQKTRIRDQIFTRISKLDSDRLDVLLIAATKCFVTVVLGCAISQP